ncbi:hypothetical protein QZH41_017600 [Actinostola sp. cb2023]|nr:hypothetical protein QZH41_017600 [Actinostola sp. cb2023]
MISFILKELYHGSYALRKDISPEPWVIQLQLLVTLCMCLVAFITVKQRTHYTCSILVIIQRPLQTLLKSKTMHVTNLGYPVSRCDHDCTVIGEKFYICGGSGGEAVWFNDIYCFDTVTLVWYYINAQGHLPHPRSLHTICAHHDKDIYLFGGANDSPSCKTRSPFGDVFKFSLSKMKWKKVHCEGPSPDRRLGHTACIAYGQMIVFGGMNDEKDYNDLAILQTRAAAKQLPPVMAGK